MINKNNNKVPELLDVPPTIKYIPDAKPIKREDIPADSFIVTSDNEKNLYINNNSAFKSFYDTTIEFTQSAQRQSHEYNLQFKTPAYPPAFITFLTRKNWVFGSCAERVANDSTKNGFDITARAGVTDDEDINAKEELMDFFNQMPKSIVSTLRQCIYDYKTGGNAGIEIVRENGLESPLQHFLWFDVENVKLCTDNKRIVQTIDGQDTFFIIYGTNYENGQKQYLNRITGEWSDTPLNPEEEAHEVLWFYRHDRGCNEYGIPNIAKGLDVIEIELGRTNYVLDFFVNFGMPAWVVSITGTFYDEERNKYLPDGTLNPKFDITKTIRYKVGQQIQEIIDGGRHGAIVMSFPTTMGQDPVQINITPLATDTKEASFRGLADDDGRAICRMMNVDPNLIFGAEAGAMGNNALDSTLQQHNDNEVKPMQNIFGNEINKLLLFENDTSFKYDISNQKFKLLDYIEQNITESVNRDKDLVLNGLMTAREFQVKYSKALGINSENEEPLLDEYCIRGVPIRVLAEKGSINENDLNNINKQVIKAGGLIERKRRNLLQAKKYADKGFIDNIKKKIHR